MEVGLNRVLLENEHITVGSNLYDKVKSFKCLGYLLTNENCIHEYIDLK